MIPPQIAIGTARVRVSRPWSSVILSTPSVSIPLAIQPSGQYVFAALPTDNQVGVIDQETREVVAKISVPAKPEATVVTPDATRVYVTLANGTVAVIDAIALQLIDADTSTPEIDTIPLGTSASPFCAAIDPGSTFLYVADTRSGVVYQIDILADDTSPISPAFHKVVSNIQVGPAPLGLRGIAVNATGERLFVAAPSAGPFGTVVAGAKDLLHVIGVNPGNNDEYLQTVTSLESGSSSGNEVYAVEATPDPNTILFTNRQSGRSGIGFISGANGPIGLMEVSNLPFQITPPPQYTASFQRYDFDSFDVNNAQGIAYLPAGTLSQSNPGHGGFLFVSAYNFLNQAVPSRNPDHPDRRKGVPAGGNIAIVRLSSDSSDPTRVVAATRPIPFEFLDNLVLSEDGKRLFAAYRGFNDAVFVYDVEEMISEVEFHATRFATQNPTTIGSNHPVFYPINNLSGTTVTANADIDLNADYRLDVPFSLTSSPQEFKNYDPTRAPIGFGDGQPRGLSLQKTPQKPLQIQSIDRVQLATQVSYINAHTCAQASPIFFSLSKQARVTLYIDGEVATNVGNPLDGGATTLAALQNLDLPAGNFEALLSPIGQLQAPGNYDFRIEAVDSEGEITVAEGIIEHELVVDAAYPIGHTMVKGVDLWDGHVTQSAQDVFIPGRGLSLDFSRHYSSAGNSSSGPLGAGWTHSYNVRLVQSCGVFTVVGGEGSGNSFDTTTAHTDAAWANAVGIQEDAIFFDPQIGYHSTLVQPVPGDTTEFDFYTKSHVRYHFAQSTAGPFTDPSDAHVLRFIEEPNGNRISLYYAASDAGATALPAGLQSQFDDDPETLDIVTDSSGRALVLTYETVANEDRLVHLAGYGVNGIDISYNYDEQLDPDAAFEEGNLTSVVNAGQAASDTRVQSYSYTAGIGVSSHNLLTYTGPNGNTTEYDYHSPGGPSLSTPGIITSFDIAPYEFIRQVKEPATNDHPSPITNFTYNISGVSGFGGTRIVTSPRPGVGPTTYTLNAYGATTQIDEPLGRTTKMEWATPDNPQPTSIVHGYPSRPGVDVLIVSQTDSLGRRTNYRYDDRGNVIEESVTFSVAAAHLEPTRDKDGNDVTSISTTYTYDPIFSKRTSQTDPEGNTTQFVIDTPLTLPFSVPSDAPSPNGSTGNLLATIDAVGNITQFAYKPNGDLDFTVDPRGQVTEYVSYDAFGNATMIEDAEGNVTARVYDNRSRMELTFGSFGHHIQRQYDNLDRVIRETKLDDLYGLASETTDYAFLPGGQIRRITDGLGQVTEYDYDELNRPILVTDHGIIQADGSSVDLTVHNSYDEFGNLVLQIDARGVMTENTYDQLNRRTRTRILDGPSAAPVGIDGVIMEMQFDTEHNELFMVDLNGDRTDYVYDGLYRVTQTLLPFENTFADVPIGVARARTETGYDLVGNVVRQTDANGHAAISAYDDIYRLTSTTDADGNRIEHLYDASSNVVRTSKISDGITTSVVTYDDGVTIQDGLNRPSLISETVFLGDPASAASVQYKTAIQYDDAGNRIVTTNPRGFDLEERRDGLGRVHQTIVASGDLDLTTTNTFDGNGNTKTIQDAQNGDIDVTFTYDGLNRPIRADYLLDDFETWTYDGVGNVVQQTDKRSTVFTTAYDNLNRPLASGVVEMISGSGQNLVLKSVQYDDPNRTIHRRDANGNLTTSVHDGLDRIVVTTDPFNDSIVSTYDGVNRRTETDKKGHSNLYVFDPINRLIETRELDAGGALQTTISTAYEDGHNRVIENDRRGTDNVRLLDSRGRLIQFSRRHPDLAAVYGTDEVILENYQYDGNNNQTLFIDAAGNQTAYQYDPADRMTIETAGFGSAVASATTYTYDSVNNVLTIKDGRDHGGAFDASFVYDTRYRKLSESNGEAETTIYTYDGNDNVVTMTEPLAGGRITVYAYDELNTLLSVDLTRGGAGDVTYFRYDGNRNKIAQQDANRNLVTYRYDGLNRLTDSFQHFAAGAINASTQRGGSFGGDETTAQHWVQGYDPNSNQNLAIDANGQRTDLSFDYLDRVSTAAFSNHINPNLDFQAQTVAYAYDGNSNLISRDEVKQVSSTNITQSYTFGYDRLDRMSLSTNFDGLTIGYAYDAQGNRTSVTDPDGLTNVYTYDARNRLRTAMTEAGVTTYEYYDDNLLHSVLYPNGVVADYSYADSYDRADRLTRVVHHTGAVGDSPTPTSLIASFSYTYDDNGNRTSQTEAHTGINGGVAEGTTYAYDLLNRVTDVSYGPGGINGQITYDYDAVGNRIAELGSDPSDPSQTVDRTYHYDRLNRLRAIISNNDPVNSIAYDYDENGNRISKTVGQVTVTPDAAGNPIVLIINPVQGIPYQYGIRDELLVTPAVSGGDVTFDYDANRMRVRKTSASGQTRYLYDGRSTLLEYDGSFDTKIKYDYGYQLISLAEVDPAGSTAEADRDVQFYHYDALGSAAALTDEAGGLQKADIYDAWGDLRDLDADGNPLNTGSSANPKQFTGHYRDDETELQYFGARYYDDDIGAFITQDSYLGMNDVPPSLHRYLYAYANPAVYVDPTGNYSMEKFLDHMEAFSRTANWATHKFQTVLMPFAAPDKVLTPQQQQEKIQALIAQSKKADQAWDEGRYGRAIAGYAGLGPLADRWNEISATGGTGWETAGTMLADAIGVTDAVEGFSGVTTSNQTLNTTQSLDKIMSAVDKVAGLITAVFGGVQGVKYFLNGKSSGAGLLSETTSSNASPSNVNRPLRNVESGGTAGKAVAIEADASALDPNSVKTKTWSTGKTAKPPMEAAIDDLEYGNIHNHPGSPVAFGTYGPHNLVEASFQPAARSIGARTLGTMEAVPKSVRSMGRQAIVDHEMQYLHDARAINFFRTGLESATNTPITWMELTAIRADPTLMAKTRWLRLPEDDLFHFSKEFAANQAKQAAAAAAVDNNQKQVGTVSGTSAAPLNFSVDITAISTAALSHWASVLGSIGPMQITLAIEDLPESQVGEARITRYSQQGLPAVGTIVLDSDAAGVGWFVDATPNDATEFEWIGDSVYRAISGSEATGKYDLATVLSHEIGHLLGFGGDHSAFDSHVVASNDAVFEFVVGDVSALLTNDQNELDDADHPQALMNATLAPGIRRLPSTIDVAILNAVRHSPQTATVSNRVAAAAAPGTTAPAAVKPFASVTIPLVVAGGSKPVVAAANSLPAEIELLETLRRNPRSVQTLVIPEDTRSIDFTIADIVLGSTPGTPADAFEVALLYSGSMLPAVGVTDNVGNTDALLNLQAGGDVFASEFVTINGPDVSIDVRHIAVGSELSLYFDLLGFGEIDSSVSISDIEFVTGDLPIDKIQDVTDRVSIDFFGRQFNRKTGVFGTRATITNHSDSHLAYPIRLALTNLTPAEAAVVNAHGTLADGTPYFDLGGPDTQSPGMLAPGMLAPGETSDDLIIAIQAGARTAYEFQPQVLAAVPEDVSNSVDVDIYGRQFNRRNGTYGFYATVQNNSANELSYPIRVLLDNLQPAGTEVVNAHGALADGTPYFDIQGEGALAIGAKTPELVIAVRPPEGQTYSFDPRVLSAVCYNHTATVTELPEPQPLLQNDRDRFDVNADGRVSVLDALNVINRIGSPEQGQVPPDLASVIGVQGAVWIDVNGDGKGSAIDALQVINELAIRRAAESEPSKDPDSQRNDRTAAIDRVFATASSHFDGYKQEFDVSHEDDDRYILIRGAELASQPQLF